MSDYATAHAYEQIFERYGIVATKQDWAKALLDVTSNRALLLSHLPHGRERLIVQITGVAVIVVYDPNYAMFVTALPPNHSTMSVLSPRRIVT